MSESLYRATERDANGLVPLKPDHFNGERRLHERPLEDWRYQLQPLDRVIVRDDEGTEAEYQVKHEPWQLRHGSWVVGLVGISGGYSLERVEKLVKESEVVLCVLCRRPNPTPASSACQTCIPPDEGEVRLQGTVAALKVEVESFRHLLRKAMMELVVIDPRRNPPRDRLVDEIEKALGETWSEVRSKLTGC